VKRLTRHLGIGLGWLFFAASLAAQSQTFVPSSDVSLKISTQRKSFKTGEAIALRYRIKNISNAALYVPREWEATCPGGPHLWAWFEDSTGRHFIPGYGGSCASSPKTMKERMGKEALLLQPGEHVDGLFQFQARLFDLKPGAYRIEAALAGWTEEKFTEAERTELTQMGSPFMTGETSDSIHITLTADHK
jgi:hypothetical protein